MIKNPSQHYLYAYKAIPTLFFTQGAEFMFYLDRDGKKFLKFWWDHEAEKLDESQLRSSDGLSFEIHDYKDRKLALIILPPPKAEPEAYFLALLGRPQKRSVFPWRNLARMMALQRRVIADSGMEATVLVDITPRLRQVDVGATCAPDYKDFYRKVVSVFDKGK